MDLISLSRRSHGLFSFPVIKEQSPFKQLGGTEQTVLVYGEFLYKFDDEGVKTIRRRDQKQD